MTIQAILLPLFVQVALTVGLMFLMASRRYAAVKARQVREADVSMGQRGWPPAAQQASNAFSNQFELPVLFYVLVVLAILTRRADLLFVVLSWVFVASRLVHAGIYATSNRIAYRLGAFLVGALVLLAMWVSFAAGILLAPAPA